MAHIAKRKRDELESSDDEDEPSFGKQVLPVARLPENFDSVPVDGMQYLFTVQRDARRLPHVVRAENPYETPESETVPQVPSLYSSHPGLPSDSWRTSFIEHFYNFRKNSLQPTMHIGVSQAPHRKLMPDKRERDNWWAFIAGRPESDWNPPKKPKQSKNRVNEGGSYGKGMRAFSEEYRSDGQYEGTLVSQETYYINEEGDVKLAGTVHLNQSLPTPSGTPAPQLQPGTDAESKSAQSTIRSERGGVEPEPLRPREPTPTLLRHIDQRIAIHLLMYFNHWINLHLQQPYPPSSYLTDTHALWIFALLSRVEDHISADDISQLRTLARSCLSLLQNLIRRRSMFSAADDSLVVRREELPSDMLPMGERSCWMIITAVICSEIQYHCTWYGVHWYVDGLFKTRYTIRRELGVTAFRAFVA